MHPRAFSQDSFRPLHRLWAGAEETSRGRNLPCIMGTHHAPTPGGARSQHGQAQQRALVRVAAEQPQEGNLRLRPRPLVTLGPSPLTAPLVTVGHQHVPPLVYTSCAERAFAEINMSPKTGRTEAHPSSSCSPSSSGLGASVAARPAPPAMARIRRHTTVLSISQLQHGLQQPVGGFTSCFLNAQRQSTKTLGAPPQPPPSPPL